MTLFIILIWYRAKLFLYYAVSQNNVNIWIAQVLVGEEFAQNK